MKNILFVLLFMSSGTLLSQTRTIPHLIKNDKGVQLIVNNRPFLMRAGELHNSTTGGIDNMKPIWKQMADKNLNTVLAAVSWELIEPQEGKFDFSLVDSMIIGARKQNLKLVLLWFGSWKNGKSTYVPEWVKADRNRFAFAKDQKGKTIEILSTFSKNAQKADMLAFVELLKHIRLADSLEQTVAMVQVENEIGTVDFRASYGMPNLYMRDFSEEANKAYSSDVPRELVNYLVQHEETIHPAIKKVWEENGKKQSGTWETVFGKSVKYAGEDWKNNFSFLTEEIFMAWHYAKYVGAIAQAGKNVYGLPMFVNAWLRQEKSKEPGQYPSGGPLPHLLDIWRAAAPSIDFIAPDIYVVDEFDWICESFSKSGNPLFIPETTADSDGAARAFYAIGKYDALGYAPFGIDGGGLMLSVDSHEQMFAKVYQALKNLEPFIQQNRGTDNLSGLFIGGNKKNDALTLGDYTINLRRPFFGATQGLVGVDVGNNTKKAETAAACIVIKLSKDEFIIAGGVGNAVINIVKSTSSALENTSYSAVDEIFYENGIMKKHRLNGDETVLGGLVIKEGEVKIFRIQMYNY